MRFGIIGIGAIGSLITTLFNKEEKKICIFTGKYPHQNLKKHGIKIKSKIYGNLELLPEDIDFSDDVNDFDVLIVSLKAASLLSALEPFRLTKNNKCILALQNGLGVREEIRKVTNCPLIIGSIGNIEIFKRNNLDFIHSSFTRPQISLASSEVALDKLSKISSLLQELQIETEIISNEKLVIWRKLVRLSSIGTLNAYLDKNLGEILSDAKAKKLLIQIVEELVEIAALENISLDSSEILNKIYSLPKELITSMARDLKIGNKSEIEFILGNPIRLGHSRGLNLPIMTKCYKNLIRSI